MWYWSLWWYVLYTRVCFCVCALQESAQQWISNGSFRFHQSISVYPSWGHSDIYTCSQLRGNNLASTTGNQSAWKKTPYRRTISYRDWTSYCKAQTLATAPLYGSCKYLKSLTFPVPDSYEVVTVLWHQYGAQHEVLLYHSMQCLFFLVKESVNSNLGLTFHLLSALWQWPARCSLWLVHPRAAASPCL